MEKINPLPAQKVIRKLKRLGFRETHSRGSHIYLEDEAGDKIVTVAMHGAKDIPAGTLHNIVIKQAGLTAEEFNAA